MQLLADAEGAAHDIAITVQHAASEADAVEVGRAVARSNLFKCAVFGRDPNWGRVLAAIGTTAADFEPDRIDVAFNGVQVCRDGGIGEPAALVDLSGREVRVEIDLRNGRARGDRLDQRPDLRLRQRERGVLAHERRGPAGPSNGCRLVEKASILTEALPWLETYAGKTVVIKYGGNAMIDEDLKRAFASDIVFMKRCGVHPVVVHGGGPQISSMLGRLGIASEFRGGLRVTTPEAMEVVRMVLVGQVGRDLVGLINATARSRSACPARTAACSPPTAAAPWSTARRSTSAWSATSSRCAPRPIEGLIDAGSVPVVASIAPDADGVVHNVNADTAAAALAVALGPSGSSCSPTSRGSTATGRASDEVIKELSRLRAARADAGLESGMVPKMEACLRAVEGGLTRATVTDGRVPHALLLEIFTNAGIGTMVTQDGLVRLGSRVFPAAEGIPPHEYANGEFAHPAPSSRRTTRSVRPDRHAELS